MLTAVIAFGFEFKRAMVDFMMAEKHLQRLPSLLKARQIMHFDVRRQGILRCAHRPDMDMVDIYYILNLKHLRFEMLEVDSMRNTIKSQNDTFLEERS